MVVALCGQLPLVVTVLDPDWFARGFLLCLTVKQPLQRLIVLGAAILGDESVFQRPLLGFPLGLEGRVGRNWVALVR